MPETLLRPSTRPFLARVQLGSLLEHLCQAIEPTPAEYQDAEEKYGAVARWLAASDDPIFRNVYLYPQGSFALGTAIRPLAAGELDVDLIVRLVAITSGLPPKVVKDAIGRRLRDHTVYRRMLEEKNRCWRLNYAGQFHMDMTGAVLNPHCDQGGELVPDKSLGCWKPTNPQGYRKWFEDQASLSPMFVTRKDLTEAVEAQIDALPAQVPLKGLLRRAVQLLKRHRDLYFERTESENAPISIIITTLAAYAHASATLRRSYETEIEFVQEVVAGLPGALRVLDEGGHPRFVLANPTTAGENFCEKWNTKPALAQAFFDWHRAVVRDLERLLQLEGLDQTRKQLGHAFGERAANAAFKPMDESIAEARRTGVLHVAPGSGVIATAVAGAVKVRPNTYFGR